MRFAIHGATGAQGGPVVTALAAAGHDVLALSRSGGTPERTAASAVRVTPAPVDLADTDALRDVYAGVDGVFLHLPIAGDPPAMVPSVIQAAADAQLAHLVYSTSGAPVHEPATSPMTRQRIEGNDRFLAGLRSAGVTVSALGPRLYLENLLLPPVWQGVVEDGVLRYPVPGDTRVSWVSHLDVADAVVALLTGEVTAGDYELGPDGLTGSQLANGFSAALDRPIAYDGVTPGRFAEMLLPLFGPEMAAGVASAYESAAGEPSLAIGADAERFPRSPRSIAAWMTDLELQA